MYTWFKELGGLSDSLLACSLEILKRRQENLRVSHPEKVHGENGNQEGEQDGVNGARLCTGEVEVQSDKPDADMQEFARDFMFVDEGAPLPVYRDQAQRARTSGERAPVFPAQVHRCASRREV